MAVCVGCRRGWGDGVGGGRGGGDVFQTVVGEGVLDVVDELRYGGGDGEGEAALLEEELLGGEAEAAEVGGLGEGDLEVGVVGEVGRVGGFELGANGVATGEVAGAEVLVGEGGVEGLIEFVPVRGGSFYGEAEGEGDALDAGAFEDFDCILFDIGGDLGVEAEGAVEGEQAGGDGGAVPEFAVEGAEPAAELGDAVGGEIGDGDGGGVEVGGDAEDDAAGFEVEFVGFDVEEEARVLVAREGAEGEDVIGGGLAVGGGIAPGLEGGEVIDDGAGGEGFQGRDAGELAGVVEGLVIDGEGEAVGLGEFGELGVEVGVERLGRAGADDAAVFDAERGAVAGGRAVLGLEGENGGEEPVFHGFS